MTAEQRLSLAPFSLAMSIENRLSSCVRVEVHAAFENGQDRFEGRGRPKGFKVSRRAQVLGVDGIQAARNRVTKRG
jgi:hypothetical protein